MRMGSHGKRAVCIGMMCLCNFEFAFSVDHDRTDGHRARREQDGFMERDLYTTCMAGRYGSDIVALDYFDSETNFMAGYISES